MLNLVPNDTKRYSRFEAIHAAVSRFLYEAFSTEGGLLSNVDRWTQRKVTLENLTKIELAHAADDLGLRQLSVPRGDHGHVVPLRKLLGDLLMDNAAAARTHSVLAGEGRRVVVAFILGAE